MAETGLLIFDLDGTLFRTETASVPAVRRTFQDFGLPIPRKEEIAFFFGRPASEFHAWLRTRCPPEHEAQLLALIGQRELALVAQTGELYPGVKKALSGLRASSRAMAICSNGPQDYVEQVLSSHGLAAWFDAVRYRQSEQDSKPAMVRELLERLGGRPALVIGDRREDIEAAHQNGIAAIAAAYGYGEEEEIAWADGVALSPADLPALVRRLLGQARP